MKANAHDALAFFVGVQRRIRQAPESHFRRSHPGPVRSIHENRCFNWVYWTLMFLPGIFIKRMPER